MAVLVEEISVVVRRDSIDTKFKGGWEAFLNAVQNITLCYDDDLVCFTLMDSRDLTPLVAMFQQGGLIFNQDDNFVDIAVVDEKDGPACSTNWLQFMPDYFPIDNLGNTLSGCWFIRNPLPVYGVHMPAGWNQYSDIPLLMPEEWSYDKSFNKKHVLLEETSKILKFLRRKDDVDIYLDLETGEKKPIARPIIEGDKDSAIYRQLETNIRKVLDIERQIEDLELVDDEEGIEQRSYMLNNKFLPRIQQIAENGGANVCLSHFILGSILRLLRRTDEARLAFHKADQIEPGVINVLFEIANWFLDERQYEKALQLSFKAVDLASKSAIAWGNLAIVLIRCGDRERGQSAIDRAIELGPRDRINRTIDDNFDELCMALDPFS